MQVLVTGATGFIGSHFVPFLAQRGHAVQRVTRRPSRPGDVAWDPARGEIDAAALRPPDAVVHLSGREYRRRPMDGGEEAADPGQSGPGDTLP